MGPEIKNTKTFDVEEENEVGASSGVKLDICASSSADCGASESLSMDQAVVLSRNPSRDRAKSDSGFFHMMEGEESGGESDTLTNVSETSDTASTRSEYLRSRKRVLSESEDKGSSSDNPKDRSKAKAKRGRGRPPKITHYVGVAEAQRELSAARKERLQLELEEQLLAKERQARLARAKSGYGVAIETKYEDKSVAELEKIVEEDVDGILEIAAKSSNLKGTFQKGLKDRALSAKAALGELVKRSVSEETKILQATIDRLQLELDQFKKEIQELRVSRINSSVVLDVSERMETCEVVSAVSDAQSSPSSQDIKDLIREELREVVLQERNFARTLIEGIQDRLLPEKRLRPPLAADRKRGLEPIIFKVPEPPKPKPRAKKSAKNATPALPDMTASLRPGLSEGVEPTAAVVFQSSQSCQEDAFLPSSTPANDGWTTVVRKGRKSRRPPSPVPNFAAAAATPVVKNRAAKPNMTVSMLAVQKAEEKTKHQKKKLSSPRSAVVVVTLTDEAVKRGETYESVLRKAREKVDTSQLGPARCRQTMTGARKFEFPGAQSASQADLFAEKLKEAIADSAKVMRPTKCVSLVISDLDDSISKSDIVDKVAVVGGCSADQIKVGEIHSGRGGMGKIRLQCPIAAAKAIVDKGRLLVGFSSASVRVLENQPLRCFKCYGTGHTRMLCPSATERTELCFRCGKSGHKAASCSEKANCAVCADSRRPAGHVMGGKSCNPPPKKGKARVLIRPTVQTAAVLAAGDEAMSE